MIKFQMNEPFTFLGMNSEEMYHVFSSRFSIEINATLNA